MSLLNVGAAGTAAETPVVVNGAPTAMTMRTSRNAGTSNRRIANLQAAALSPSEPRECLRVCGLIMPQGFIEATSNITM